MTYEPTDTACAVTRSLTGSFMIEAEIATFAELCEFVTKVKAMLPADACNVRIEGDHYTVDGGINLVVLYD